MSIASPDFVSDGFDVRTALSILQRNVLLIALCIVVALGAALVFLAFTPEKYTASVMMLIDPRQEQILEAEKVISANPGLDSPVVDSEVELIRSLSVTNRVISKLGLENDEEFIGKAGFFSVAKSALSSLIQRSDEQPDRTSQDPNFVQATRTLTENLDVKRRGLTYVIDISFSAKDPVKATLVANEIAAAYLDDQLDAKYASTTRATDWLSNRLDVLREAVQKAELAVEEFRAGNNLLTITGGENPFDRQLEEINKQLIAARAEVVERKLKLDRRSPSSELQKDYELALSRKVTLENQFEQLADAANDREKSAIRLRELQREADTSRDLYESFLARYKEATEQQSLQSPDSRIVSDALVPSYPSYPRKSWVLVIALFVGASSGVTLSLLREHLDDSIRTPEEVSNRTDCECLALVPDIAQSTLRKFTSGGTSSLADARYSGFTQAIRNILFNLDLPSVFGNSDSQSVLLVTSCDPNDGKTTLALAIANYAALNGAKTLLIDADIQAASASRRLGFEDEDEGIVELLKSSNANIRAYLKQVSEEPNLYALSAGQETFDAQEMIASARMQQLLDQLKQVFEVIVIDCPPVVDGMETVSLSKLADRLIFVARWGGTSSKYARKIIETIRSKSDTTIGVVLNRVNFKKLRSYTEYSSRFY
ncbi:MAG: polysaccharide biosynthesis tyrosine autokinase [Pseudomonadota bacterium]